MAGVFSWPVLNQVIDSLSSGLKSGSGLGLQAAQKKRKSLLAGRLLFEGTTVVGRIEKSPKCTGTLAEW